MYTKTTFIFRMISYHICVYDRSTKHTPKLLIRNVNVKLMCSLHAIHKQYYVVVDKYRICFYLSTSKTWLYL